MAAMRVHVWDKEREVDVYIEVLGLAALTSVVVAAPPLTTGRSVSALSGRFDGSPSSDLPASVRAPCSLG